MKRSPSLLGLLLLASCVGVEAGESPSNPEGGSGEGRRSYREGAAAPDDTWGQLIEAPPEVFFATDLSEAVRAGVAETLLAAAAEWGNYGPLEYWVLGTDEDAATALAAQFCERRSERGEFEEGACLDHVLEEGREHNFRYYWKVGSEAVASGRGGSAMGLNGNRDWGIHLYSSSYPMGFDGVLGVSPGQEQATVFHEYFHAVQSAHIYTRNHVERYALMGPVWFVEGGADYMSEVAVRKLWASGALKVLGEDGRPSFEDGFEHRMRGAKEKLARNCPGIKLHEFTYQRHCEGAAFELGAWAIAYLLHKAGQDALLKTFYPCLEELGWEGAFQETFGMSSEAFSDEFALFLEEPFADQMAILPPG